MWKRNVFRALNQVRSRSNSLGYYGRPQSTQSSKNIFVGGGFLVFAVMTITDSKYGDESRDAITKVQCHSGGSSSRPSLLEEYLRKKRQSSTKRPLPPPPRGWENLPEYTSEQVAQHNNPELDCFMSYGGFVFDATEFLKFHPGGTERIARAAGAALEPYWYLHPQHTATSVPLDILQDLVVGRLAEADQERIDAQLDELQQRIDAFTLHVVVMYQREENKDGNSNEQGNDHSSIIHQQQLSMNHLKSLPKTDRTGRIGCPSGSRGNTVSNALFGGILLCDLLKSHHFDKKKKNDAQPQPLTIRRVTFIAMDGERVTVDFPPPQTANNTTSTTASSSWWRWPWGNSNQNSKDENNNRDLVPTVDNILVAYEENGAPLSPSRGFPLRVILPKRVVKWVQRIEVLVAE